MLARRLALALRRKVADWLDYKGGDEGGSTGEKTQPTRAVVIWYGRMRRAEISREQYAPQDGVA